MKTIQEAIEAATRCLAGVGIENPGMESEFLVATLLQKTRTRLVLDRAQTLPAEQIRVLRKWLREREKRKPLAYISGEQPFRDFTLKVSSAVLVPRPETELLVEQAMRVLDDAQTPVTVIDVGTGSGNIALSLALHRKSEKVIGIDSSAGALRVARLNQRRVPRGAPVRWVLGNLLKPALAEHMRAWLIVANLPYVRAGEMPDLQPEVRWEPSSALDGGQDGLSLIKPCIEQAAAVLHAGGTLLLEIGSEQSHEVAALLKNSDDWQDIRIFCDLAGLPRIAQARRRGD